jgi:nitrate reductase NapE component
MRPWDHAPVETREQVKPPTFDHDRPPPSADPVAELLGRIAWLMDRAITVPGTRVSVGLDALLGLLPLGGDVLTGCVQTALVLVALSHYRLPRHVAARMLGNVLLDVAAGSVPLVGDLFDVAFKANTRNMELLRPYLPAGQGASKVVIDVTPSRWRWYTLAPLVLAIVGILALALVGFIAVVRWLLR